MTQTEDNVNVDHTEYVNNFEIEHMETGHCLERESLQSRANIVESSSRKAELGC